MNISLDNFSSSAVYHLMTQTVLPRPIAWVLTESSEDNFNLAPFSYFTAVASNPPLLMFSVGRKPSGEMKDTVRNALENKKMVIHIPSIEQAMEVSQTAATLEHGESEVAASNIELVEFEGFHLPRVADCAVAFACSLYESKEIGDDPQTLIFAKIESIYVNPDYVKVDGERITVDAKKVSPLARLGNSQYAQLGDIFSLQRPK